MANEWHRNLIRAGIMGVVVADALGVPVEFQKRDFLKKNPVVDMREYGSHNQPRGTWSDDSSMMLATLDSMIKCRSIDYSDIMERFYGWCVDGEYTPHGKVFDIGMTCSRAIYKYKDGVDLRECGKGGEMDNGNGSLMRIMPVSLHEGFIGLDWMDETRTDRAVEEVHGVSALTHAHPRSQMACMIYTFLVHELMHWSDKTHSRSVLTVCQDAMDRAMELYRKGEGKPWYNEALEKELSKDSYARLYDLTSFKTLPESEIKSTGYVVDTLEAAVWCLLNTDNYKDCVLKAVNLGNDTDTVGAVAGGLAGVLYGYDAIPTEWIDVIVSKDWILKLCDEFAAFEEERGT